MNTSFERGKNEGAEINPQDGSLQEWEQIYQEEMQGIPDIAKKDPVLASEHSEYMQGWIKGARELYHR
jgi:hypothetical protein